MTFKKNLIIFLTSISFISCSTISQQQEGYTNVHINNLTIEAKIARTPEEKQQGLMFVKHLYENEGMLFVWEDEKTRSFWMKNTLIPLDILFINKDFEIVDIITMTPCEKDPCKSYSSNTKSSYALEVNAGWAKENNIKKGQKTDPIITYYTN